MIHITKTQGDYDGCSQNPDLLSGIYMNLVMESHFHIIAKNTRKIWGEKRSTSQWCKKAACIAKKVKSFHNILDTVENLRMFTNTMEDSTDSLIRGILYLSSDTPKEALFNLGEDISELPDLKKRTVAVDIIQR